MSFLYSGLPGARVIDRYRFMLGDTNDKAPIFQDEEIQFVIEDVGPDENRILHKLFSTAAVRFARDIKRRLGPQSEDPSGRLDFFKSKADEYAALIQAAGISMAKPAYPKIFRKGMQSNPPYPAPRGGGEYV